VIYTVIPYANVPGCQVDNSSFPNGQLADSVNNVLSHELFETITDPDGNAWRLQGSPDGMEIGDLCHTAIMNFSINGKLYDIQLEYNNFSHWCAADPEGMMPLFFDLGFPWDDGGLAISADGTTVVGTAVPIPCSLPCGRAVRWTGASLTNLGFMSAGDTVAAASGVNSDGSVVVGYSGNDAQSQGYRWTAAGGMVPLGISNQGTNLYDAVSADGSVVVGTTFFGTQAERWTAVYWSGGTAWRHQQHCRCH
jgi:probable HAF family extracellular repeat protein